MQFTLQHINRLNFAYQHILVVEDDSQHQAEFTDYLRRTIAPRQGNIDFSVVSTCIGAAGFIQALKDAEFEGKPYIRCIILDHDMGYGNATNLIGWMRENNIMIPVITASGIPHNNDNMLKLGTSPNKYNALQMHHFQKQEVIDGKATEIIKGYLD